MRYLVCSILTISCYLTPLTAQEIIPEKFFRGNDDLATYVMINASITSQEHFIQSGIRVTECGPQSFLYFVRKEPPSGLNNPIDFGHARQSFSLLRVIDGALYAVATADKRFAHANPHLAILYKIDLDSRTVLWEQHLNNDLGIEEALDIQAYDKQGLMLYLRASGGTANIMYLMSQSSTEFRLDWTFGNKGAPVGNSFASDSNGNLYLEHPDRVLKLAASELTFSDTLWSHTPNNSTYTRILSSDIDRVTVLTDEANVESVNSLTGDLLYSTLTAPLGVDEEPSEWVLQHPHIYFAWSPDEASDSLAVQTSKFDLVRGKTLWHNSTEFDSKRLGKPSLALDTSGQVIVACLARTVVDKDSGSVVLAYLDGSSGELHNRVEIDDQYEIRGTPLVRNANGASRVFFEKDYYGSGRIPPTVTSYEIDPLTHELKFPKAIAYGIPASSAVKKIIPNSRGYTLIEQEGQRFNIRQYDERNRLGQWKQNIFWHNFDLEILNAVAGRNNFAVVCHSMQNKPRAVTDNHWGKSIGREVNIFTIIMKSHFFPGALGKYTYWQRSGDSVVVDPHILAIEDEFFFLLHDPARDGEAYRILKMVNIAEETSNSIPVKLSQRPGTQRLLAGLDQNVLLLGAADENSDTATVWQIDPDSLSYSPLITWPECNELLRGIRYDNKLVAVGAYTPPDLTERLFAEILHADLSTGESEWRLRLEHIDNAQLLLRNSTNGELYVIGEHHSSNSQDFNLIVSCLNEIDGTVVWQRTVSIEGVKRMHPIDAILLNNSLLICGDQVAYEDSTAQNSFVLQLNSKGETQHRHFLQNVFCHDLYLTRDGIPLLGASHINSDCEVDGALYRLDPITGVTLFNSDMVKQLQLFPNPADGACFLVFPGVPGSKYSIVVRDLLGRRVFETSARLQDAEAGLRLETEGFESGVYSVEISGNGQVYQGMLLRQ